MSIIIITVGLTLLAEELTRWIAHSVARATRHRKRARNHHQNGLAIIQTAQLPIGSSCTEPNNK